jgi:hypothetical protein
MAFWAVASAEASWSPPFPTSGYGWAYSPAITASSNGTTTVAWHEDRSVWIRRVAADGVLGRARKISRTDEAVTLGPWIDADRVGNAAIAWCVSEDSTPFCQLLKARRLGIDGSLGRVHRITPAVDPSRTELADARVAVDARGNATIAWATDEWRPKFPGDADAQQATVHARRLARGDVLGPTVDLPADGGVNGAPRVAVDQAGRALVAWRWIGPSSAAVRSATIGRGGRLGATREVGPAALGVAGGGLEVELDAEGRPAFTWLAPARDGVSTEVVARLSMPDGELGPTHSIAPSGHDLELALRPNGDATVSWHSPSPEIVRVRRLSRDGSLGKTMDMSSPGTLGVFGSDLAVDSLGRATVIWALGSPNVVQARQIAPDGRVGSVQTLDEAPPTESGRMASPAVAGSSGAMVGVWLRRSAQEDQVQTARLARPCPTVRLLRASSRPTGGRSSRSRLGLRVRLAFNRAADFRIARAGLSYRKPQGGRRHLTLPPSTVTIGKRGSVVVRLHRRARQALTPGQRVSLQLRVRARAQTSGCAYRASRATATGLRVGWVR